MTDPSRKPDQTESTMEQMFQNIEEQVRMAEAMEGIDVSHLKPINGFTSNIRFMGSPILPPLMTHPKREEMCMYKRQATMIETQIRARARQKLLMRVQTVMAEIDARHTPQPPFNSTEDPEIPGAVGGEDSGISSRQQGHQPPGEEGREESLDTCDTMADVTDLSSEDKADEEEEEEEVPHLPLDKLVIEDRPHDSVADSGVAQSGDVSTPRTLTSTLTNTSELQPIRDTSETSPEVPSETLPTVTENRIESSELKSPPTVLPAGITKSKSAITKASVYSSSSGTMSSEEMNRTVIEKDEESGDEAAQRDFTSTGEFEMLNGGIPRQTILRHDMEEPVTRPDDVLCNTGSTDTSGQLRASLLDRVDLVDEEWSEEGPSIVEIDGPDPCSPRQDAQTQAGSSEAQSRPSGAHVGPCQIVTAGPSQSTAVQITASPSSAFQAVRPGIRPQAGSSIITPRTGALQLPAPADKSQHSSPEDADVSPQSEGNTQASDSMLYTESTELAPYMAASCAVTDDTLDTLPQIPDLTASMMDQNPAAPSQSVGVLPSQTEEPSREFPDSGETTDSDAVLRSPPSASRVRRGSYTLEGPSPALVASARENSVSDNSSKTSSSAKSKSVTPGSRMSSNEKDKPTTQPTQDHSNPGNKQNFLTSSMEDLQLKPVQRKLDYDDSSSGNAAPPAVKKAPPKEPKSNKKKADFNKPKKSPEQIQTKPSPVQNVAEPTRTGDELVAEPQTGRPDLSEAVGSEQEGKQEHLARYLEHLSQMPPSTPSGDSPRYSAPSSAERPPHPATVAPGQPDLPQLSSVYPSHSNTSLNYVMPQGYGPPNPYTYPGMVGNHGSHQNISAAPSESYVSLNEPLPGAIAMPSLSDPDLNLLQLQAQQFDLMRRQMMQQQQQQLAQLLAEQERQQLLLQQEIITQQIHQHGKPRDKRKPRGKPAGVVSDTSVVSDVPSDGQVSTRLQSRASLIPVPTHPYPQNVGDTSLDYSHVSYPSRASSQDARPQTAPVPKVSFNLDSSHVSVDDTRYSSFSEAPFQSPAVLRTMQAAVIPEESASPRTRNVVSQNLASPDVLSRVTVQHQTISEEDNRKFEKLSALIKGHLTRRLMKSEKVQQIIKTIKDTAEFACNFIQESPIKKGVYSNQDKDLQGRVLNQLTAAMYEFYEVFFETSSREKMMIIHQSRMAELERLRASTASRPTSRLSAATLKAQERRRKAQAVEASLFGESRSKSAPPPHTSSPRHDRKQDSILGGPLRRNYQFLMSKAMRPGQSQISPIKPIKDNLNRAAKKSTSVTKKPTAKVSTARTNPASQVHSGKVTKTTKTMVRNTAVKPRRAADKKSPPDTNKARTTKS